MMARSKIVHKVMYTGGFVSLSGMLVVVSIQVFSRFFMDNTPSWTEEAARMFFIYSVAFGTGIGIKNGDFITLDLIGRYLSPRAEKLLNFSISIIIIAFSIILIITSFQFVMLGMDERSPALEISMSLVFISMIIIGLAIAYFTLEHLYGLIKKLNKG